MNDFHDGTRKRGSATKPFIDGNAQCILIAGLTWPTLKQFWGHIRSRPDYLLLSANMMGGCTRQLMHRHGQAKVAEHQNTVLSQQHILRLDITMDNIAVMGI